MEIIQAPGTYYRIEKRLGKGGFGTVFSCLIEESTVNKVAIKQLSTANEVTLIHFVSEVKNLRSIEHRYVPKYLDHFYVIDGTERQHYLVEEFIPGVVLTDYVRNTMKAQGGMDLSVIITISMNILGFIIFMQKARLIHRDIKPENIILREGNVSDLYFIDLGTTKRINDASHMHTIIGTPGYAPPEQLAGHPVELLSDAYALGATMLFMVTGRYPASYLRSERCGGLYLDEVHLIKYVNAIDASLDKAKVRRDARIDSLPSELLEIIESLMAYDPKLRDLGGLSARLYRMLPKLEHTQLLPGGLIAKAGATAEEADLAKNYAAHALASMNDFSADHWMTHFEEKYYQQGKKIPIVEYWNKMDPRHRGIIENLRKKSDKVEVNSTPVKTLLMLPDAHGQATIVSPPIPGTGSSNEQDSNLSGKSNSHAFDKLQQVQKILIALIVFMALLLLAVIYLGYKLHQKLP